MKTKQLQGFLGICKSAAILSMLFTLIFFVGAVLGIWDWMSKVL